MTHPLLENNFRAFDHAGAVVPNDPNPPYGPPPLNFLPGGFSQYIRNVLNYGATGNGITDDTAAIQYAIGDAATSASGGIVYLPPGVYLVTANQIPGQSAGVGAALFPSNNVSLVGAGDGSTTIKVRTSLTGRADGIAFGITQQGQVQNASYITISDLTIDMSSVGSTFGSAIRNFTAATLGSDVAFRRLTILNTPEWGISWGGFSTAFPRVTVEDVVVSGAVFGGVWISLANFPVVHALYADRVTGHSASGEGCVLEVESGNYLVADGVTGASLPISLLLLSGNLRGTITNVAGSCGSGADGVRISGETALSMSNIVLTGGGGGGDGLHFQSANSRGIAISGLNLGGFTNDIVTDASITVDQFALSNFALSDATAINLSGTVSGLSVSNGSIEGASNAWLNVNAGSTVSGVITGIALESSTVVGLGGTVTALAIRNVQGYNPIGVVVVGVPGSGSPVAAVWYDRTFYVTANAAGSCTLAISNGPTVTLAASAIVAVTVPAGQTLTPTYTNAPSWVVEGL